MPCGHLDLILVQKTYLNVLNKSMLSFWLLYADNSNIAPYSVCSLDHSSLLRHLNQHAFLSETLNIRIRQGQEQLKFLVCLYFKHCSNASQVLHDSTKLHVHWYCCSRFTDQEIEARGAE